MNRQLLFAITLIFACGLLLLFHLMKLINTNSAAQKDNSPIIEINIHKGKYFCDGTQYEARALTTRLHLLYTQYGNAAPVVIDTDKEVVDMDFTTVIEPIITAGFWNLHFMKKNSNLGEHLIPFQAPLGDGRVNNLLIRVANTHRQESVAYQSISFTASEAQTTDRMTKYRELRKQPICSESSLIESLKKRPKAHVAVMLQVGENIAFNDMLNLLSLCARTGTKDRPAPTLQEVHY